MPSALKKVLLILAIVLMLVVLAIAVVLGLAASDGGTRVLAERLRKSSGGMLDWEQLEGSLSGGLELRGLQLRQEGLQAEVDSATLAWRPGALLGGELVLEQLELRGIRVQIASVAENEPPDTQPFRPGDLPLPLDMQLGKIELRDIEVYLEGQQEPQLIERVTLSARLEDRRLALEQLELQAPQGGLSASGELTLSDELPMDLQLGWQWALEDERRLGGQLALSGDAAELTISHRGEGDLPIEVSGQLRDILGQPGWELALQWPQIDPLGTGEGPLLGPGSLESQGNIEAYSLAGESEFQIEGMEAGHWSLRGSGDANSLHLAPLAIALAPGEVEVSGDLDWRDAITVELSYLAHGEQLDEFSPELPPRLDARGRLSARYLGEEVNLEEFSLALEQAPLQVGARARLTMPADSELSFDASLEWSELGWPLQAAAPGMASALGRLAAEGTPSAYDFSVATDIGGSELPAGEWRGTGSGNTEQLSISSLQGATLDGVLDLAGSAGWVPQPRWELQLTGRDLDPGQWLADFPGRLALSAQTDGYIDPELGIQAQVSLPSLSGTLQDRQIALRAGAAVNGDKIHLQDLALDSGGSSASASGQLAPAMNLAWELQSATLGDLVPGAYGSLAASGRVTGSPESPGLQVRLRGSELGMDDIGVALLEGDLQMGLDPSAPLEVDIRLGQVEQGGQPLVAQLAVTGQGKTSAHRLELALDTLAEELTLRLEGALDGESMAWQGQLAELAARSPEFGSWQLSQAAELAIATDAMTLQESCLEAAEDDATICLHGGWQALSGADLSAQISALPAKRLLPKLSGELSGEVSGTMAADGLLRAQLAMAMSAGTLRLDLADGAKYLAHEGGDLELSIDDSGLAAALGVHTQQRQLLAAELKLPAFDRLPMADKQPLGGSIQAELRDLSGLSALVPELSHSAGRLQADLQFAGSLEQPLILGDLALDGGAVGVPAAGLELREIVLRASGERQGPAAGSPGQLLIGGGLRSGPGWLKLEGLVDPRAASLDLNLGGERFEVYNTADANVLLSPDLDIGWRDDTLSLRGRVAVPEASLTPKLGISPGMLAEDPDAAPETGRVIAPSADVVVVGVDGEIVQAELPEAPFRLDSLVELALGDDVEIDALGLRGALAGTVSFSHQPSQAGLIPDAKGRLSIEDGSFKAFGQDLDIETGQLIFNGGPATEPEAELRAVRWIDNDPQVTAAGVMIAGSATEPNLELFSRPQLDPMEVQSYLLTGRSAGDGDTVLSIGTQLLPKVYVGYGYNLLEETSEFNSLYTISPRYGVGFNVGEADNNINLTFTHER